MIIDKKVNDKERHLKFVKKKLQERDLKLTPQRTATLDVLFENQSKHLSTEDIYELVKKKYPDIGLATIYRTLQLFDEFDIIKKLNFGDGRYRYELTEEEKHQHHHLLCLGCGDVLEFDYDLLDNLENKIEEKNDFLITDHIVKFFGYCKKCRKKQ